MTKFFRKYTRLLAICMTVLILNLSIDAPDPVRFVNHRYVTTEDLSVNEIKSISEWILEDVCNIPNAVPETDDDDATSIVKHFVDYYFFNNHFLAASIPISFSLSFKAVHLFVPSLWYCDAIIDLIKATQAVTFPDC